MELIITHISKSPIGCGHYVITLHTDSGEIKHVTSSALLIDAMDSDDDELADEAKRVAVEVILEKNGYYVESVISECGHGGAYYVAQVMG